MAENGLNHLIYHENGETGGYDNEAFNHRHPEKLKRKKSIEDREKHTINSENGHLHTSPTNCLTNGHGADRVAPGSPTLTNGSAVVVLDCDDNGTQNGLPDNNLEGLNVNLNVDTGKELKCPLDTKLRHYVPLDDEGKMLNSEDELRISIPDDAIINYNTGRIRIQNHQSKSHSPLPKSCHVEAEEKIPMQDMSCTLPQLQEDSEKALEAGQDLHQNGRTSEEYEPDLPSSEKQGNGAGPFDEYFIPVNTHKKYLRGEKLYLTKDSKQLCQNWRRVIICGLIAIVIAVAILVGVLAATGILLAESESKNTRHEIKGYGLPDTASISLAGRYIPRPAKVPQGKLLPPTTIAVPESTTSFSQSFSEVTPIVPVAQPNTSQSHTIVPNALVGEFTIVDENFTHDLNDDTSYGYLSLATTLETELSRIFEQNGGNFQELKILKFRPGSIIVKFVVVWKSEHGVILAKRAYQIMKLHLKKSDDLILAYRVKRSSLNFMDVINQCRIKNGGCMHDCQWSYLNSTKICICPADMDLMPDGSCVEKVSTSEIQVFDFSTTELTSIPEMTVSEGSITENISEMTTASETMSNKVDTVAEEGSTTSTVLPLQTDEIITNSATLSPTVHDGINTTLAVTTSDSNVKLAATTGISVMDQTTTPIPVDTTVENKTIVILPIATTIDKVSTTQVDGATTEEINAYSHEETTVNEVIATTLQVDTTSDDKVIGTTLPTTTGQNEVTLNLHEHTTIDDSSLSVDTTVTDSNLFTKPETSTTDKNGISTKVGDESYTVTSISSPTMETSTLPSLPPEEVTTVSVHHHSIATEKSNSLEYTTASDSVIELGEVTTDPALMSDSTATESSNTVTNKLSTETSMLGIHTNIVPHINTLASITTDDTTVSDIPSTTLFSASTDTTVSITTPSISLTNRFNRTPEVRFYNNYSVFTPSELNLYDDNNTGSYTETVLMPDDLNTTETAATTSLMVATTLIQNVTLHTNIHLNNELNFTLSTDDPYALVNITNFSSEVSTEAHTAILTKSATTEIPTSVGTQSPETTSNFVSLDTTNDMVTNVELLENVTGDSVSTSFSTTGTASTISSATDGDNNTVDVLSIENDSTTQPTTDNTTLLENLTFSSNDTTLEKNVTAFSTTENLVTEITTERFHDDNSTFGDKTIVSQTGFVTDTTTDTTTTISTFEFGTTSSDVFVTTTTVYTTFDEFSKLTTQEDYNLNNSTLNDTTMMNVTVGIECRDDQFLCSSLNVCLNNTFICDGIEDCPDGLDENECTETCNLNFKCANSSVCIMSDAQCDGVWDCVDGSDEQNCTPTECAKHEVMCLDGSTCIKPGHICDWKYNCRDRSDEVGCVERTTCETGSRFFCNDGLCIPWSLKCDGNYDCKDKEDEGNCTCLEDEFKCNDGKCLKGSSRCDGHRDCINAEDELGCVNVDEQGMVIAYVPFPSSWSLLCGDDWTLDDGHYLCQELGFGHALSTEKHHVSFNGTWVSMKRDNLTSASLWTERLNFGESCSSNLAAGVVCQKYDCGNYSGLLHRRKRQSDGLTSPTTQWPFIAYVSTFRSSKGCLSEILTPVWLITSAECLLSIGKEPHNGSDWYVRTNVAKGFNSDFAQNHEVMKIILHPHSSKFRSLILRDYDVALIRLKHALVFSDKIGAICLPEEQVSSGITCFSGVLGTEKPRAPPPLSPTISSLALMVLERDSCNVPDHYNDQINHRMLCTKSSDSQSVCDNDEGTPLMCLSGPNKWYLAGMLTYQRLCGVYNWHPAVFSNLFAMRNFIDQVIGHRQYGTQYDSTLYVIMPPTTVGPVEMTTEPVLITEREFEVTLITPADKMTADTYDSLENGTLFPTSEEEMTVSNITDNVPTDNVTEPYGIDITFSDNETALMTTDVGNFPIEEEPAEVPEVSLLNGTHEFLPLKQPHDSESGFDTNTDMYQSSTLTFDNSETVTDSSGLTPASFTEDFVVEVMRSNFSEQNSGYVSLTDTETLTTENIIETDSTVSTTMSLNESSTNTENINVLSAVNEETTLTLFYPSTSPDENGSTVSGVSETQTEATMLYNSSSVDDNSTLFSGGMNISIVNNVHDIGTETEEGGSTGTRYFELPRTESDETSTSESGMLVKEYVMKSRNIDLPLEFHANNSIITVEEVETGTHNSLQSTDTLKNSSVVSPLTETTSTTSSESTVNTALIKTTEWDNGVTKNHTEIEKLSTIGYTINLNNNEDTTVVETTEGTTIANVMELQNSSSQTTTILEITTQNLNNDL